MKKHAFIYLTTFGIAFASLWFAACHKDNTDSGDINTLVYPPASNPMGKSYSDWSKLWWNWIMSMPCATNPSYDTDGSFTAQNQSGPVYFLAGTSNTTAYRYVTIPPGTAIFFPIFNFINDYPCPDQNFQPAPGETLEHFLKTGATSLVNSAESLEASLDGTLLRRPIDYRAATDLFYFTANADLAGCIDNCITGASQPGVSDGYWVMLKPLSKGKHTLQFKARLDFPWGFQQDVTYVIKIE